MLLLSKEHFGYSYRELNWQYVSGNPLTDNHSDWRYRYNAMGEREQKRLYHAPLADSIAGQPYPWVYYLLGGSKDQLAVWHGQQMTSPFCDTVRRRNVFLYPTEYLTNGIGWNGVHEDITPIITKPDGSKEYRISDHLASLRVSLTIGSAMKGYDYDPWGNLLGGATAPRRGFNDNEKDKENGVFSLGVRKYEEGRFLSLDPLFEKEPEISPYVYAGNAPLNYVDPEGKQRGAVFDGFDPLDFYDNNMLDGGGPGGVASRGSGMGVREFVSKVWQRVVGSGAISPAHRGAQASARASAQAHVNMERNSSAQAAKSSGGGGSGGNSGGGGGNGGGSSNNPSASTPVGKNGSPMKVQGNTPTTINGTKFTGHALDRMQGRGILSPSKVLDVIKNPLKIHSGNSPNTTVHIGPQMKVVTNQNGDVITIIPSTK